MARSFFEGLDDEVRERLLAGSTTRHVPAGETILHASNAWARVGVVLDGVARAYLAGPDARQVTVRYIRTGGLIGRAYPPTRDQTPLGISAVTDCSIVEFDALGFVRLVRSDPTVALVVLDVFSQRLEDVYATLAARAFGSVRDRVVDHLLSLGRPDPAGRVTVPLHQQELADSVGSVREVVARVLHDLREDGLVATSAGRIEILDPERLASTLRYRATTSSD